MIHFAHVSKTDLNGSRLLDRWVHCVRLFSCLSGLSSAVLE